MEVNIIYPADAGIDSFLLALGLPEQWKSRIDMEVFYCGIELRDSDRLLARSAVYINNAHEVDGKLHGCIGNIYSIEDYEVFRALMDAAELVLNNVGISQVIGPMDGSTWNSYRYPVAGNGSPFLLEPQTLEYLPGFFDKYGYKVLAEYYSSETELLVDNWEKVGPLYDKMNEEGVQFVPFNKENAEAEFHGLSDLINTSFGGNFLYDPISAERFVEKMMPSLPLIDERYTILAKDGEKTVGFIFSYKDLLYQEGSRLIVKTLARHPDRKYRGMGSILSSLVMKHAIEDNYKAVVHALMISENKSIGVSEKFKGERMRTYHLYHKQIERKS